MVKSRSKWRIILTIATFALLAGLIYALRKDIGGVFENLGKVNAIALFLIIPAQLLNYDSYARLYRSLLATLGRKVGYWPMYRFVLELNFVNHILPSAGVSGISYFSVRAQSVGVKTSESTLIQITKMFMLYASYQPLLILGLVLLAARGHVNNFIMLIASVLITLVVVGTLLVVYVIEDRKRIRSFLAIITKSINWIIHRFRRNHPETLNVAKAQQTFDELHDNYQTLKTNWRQLKKPFLYTMMANATEIATLYVVFIAFGHFVNIGAVILAYAVANFAGLLSVLPSGIGVYESLMIAVLAVTGIPKELSIPVTIMYRVLSMFVQLTPGYYFYQKAVKVGLSAPDHEARADS